ncbi:uncharacterized protein STEHIDRAFT_140381 [Stereum hirsutum FP-91666 SS1]|uniref:uncharacterized protein n=1 Tax=Stereum hirsutum (strain FP-91666) TaxID=721885 RepID=UPI000444A147|nr:uncharacterized protein STEHIDRAFT_140381 [Stereum hirsutum FP-91666 SS1]EIM84834.1 hypothetical protein STEHIDRAFT_140381 [Stereum hirsutum FP-91666 SS1]
MSMMMDVGKHANASGKPPPYSYSPTSTESSPPLTPAPPRKRTLSTSSTHKTRNRTRSSSSSVAVAAASFLFTPSSPPILVGPRTGTRPSPRSSTTSSSTPSSPPPYHATLPLPLPLPSTLNFSTYTDPPQTPRSRSSPHLASSRPGQHLHLRATTTDQHQHQRSHPSYIGDTSDDEQDRAGGMIFTSPRRVYVDGVGEASGSATSFRSRSSTTQALLHSTSVGGGVGGGSGSGSGSRVVKVKSISTNPAQPCAGETETEADEPSPHLPTTRLTPPSAPLIPPQPLQHLLTPLLFQAFRLLSVVPALCGVGYNLWWVWWGVEGGGGGQKGRLSRLDFAVAALWASLTIYQSLSLTTGLLHRWRLYYSPLSTLIRLLALQAICWPATHFTLSWLEVGKRPVVCWAVVGSTTCVSRSVQIWVVSNLWWEVGGEGAGPLGWKRRTLGGRWGGRRWDWPEVIRECAVPMGVCYFVMAWVEVVRREWEGC